MTAELLVNVTPSETRVAYIDGGILQEILGVRIVSRIFCPGGAQ
jgi:Ribonuclease G/E